ncbi:TlpA disulfide reductase family protein [Runella sp. SP2]|uniref:TlpA family protein disulfide reductase n=1 Tax=Runella sp. SP2 TaxID=2268026 RepID=UPI000F08AF1E|nr:TlpA disulfide reductase family protein [Runella sp. SP2]AYQ34087.1 TlpA family protein disulfide reductase [Runella sp. SP2]
MKKIFIITLLLILSTKIFAQKADTVTLAMVTKSDLYRNKFTSPARLITNRDIFKKFKGILNDLDTFAVSVIDMQLKQSLYSRIINKDIDSSTYIALKKVYKIDESKLTDKYVNQSIYIFSGIKGKEKFVVCDCNNNLDFADDELQIFDINKKKEILNWDTLKTFKAKYEYYHGKNIFNRESNIKIRPFDKSYQIRDSIKELLTVFFTIVDRKTSKINIGEKYYTVTLPFTFFKGGDYSNENVIFSDSSDYKNISIQPVPKIGDSFVFEKNTKIKIISASEFGDTLKLRIWSDSTVEVGYRTGYQIILPPFYDINIQLYDINKRKNKYTLLDFWGTWCGPCIIGLPKLKTFYQKYKDKIELISIAHDKDIEKVKKFIEEKEMNWVHKFEKNDEKNPEKLVEKLSVGCFPTFILLDKSGKILSRGCGEQQLKEIEKIMN